MRKTYLTSDAAGGAFERLRRLFMRFDRLHPVMVPVLTFAVLLVLSVGGFLYFTRDRARATDALIVIINHDKVERTVPTRPTSVGELLRKLDIPVREGDVVEPAQDTDIRQDDFRINVYRAKPVLVDDDGRKTVAFSAAVTGRSIAKQSGATLFPEDRVKIEPVTDFLAEGTLGKKVVIDRAKPVSINLYGNPVNLRTHADTVGDLLEEKHIKLSKDDQVQPAAETRLTAATQVFLLRRGVQIATITEDIAMPVESIQDAGLALGTKAVRQQGSPGKRTVTYQIQLENGKEVGRKVIQTVVTQEPVKQIEVQGTSLSGLKGNMSLAGISPGDYQYVDYIVSKESGWRPTAQNPSGAYGLCQALPGSKMASAGADWQTNPVTQLKWCNSYAVGKYGSWRAAYNFWLANHWW
jgi:uncharacterized protein YabE (DUF348 family)